MAPNVGDTPLGGGVCRGAQMEQMNESINVINCFSWMLENRYIYKNWTTKVVSYFVIYFSFQKKLEGK